MKLGIDVRWLHEAYRNALCAPQQHSDLQLPPVVDARPLGGLGGVGRYVKELLPFLATRLADAETVLFFLDDHEPPEELLMLWKSAEVSSLPGRWRPKGGAWGPFWRVHTHRRDRSVLRRVQPHGLDLFFSPHQLVIPGRGWARHAVVTCHDLAYLEHPEFYFRNGELPGSYRALYRALGNCERILAVSPATAASLQEHLGVPQARITVTYEGVSPVFWDETEPYQPEWPYLLHVGGAGPGKNLRRVVDAWQAVWDRHGSLHLILCGVSSRQLAELRVDAANTASTHVHCVPPLPDSHLNALYRGAELLLFPSLAEGFGLPVIEAMACGCPVVTSKASPMEGIAGDAALLIDPYSTEEITAATEHIMTDRSLRDSLVERGRRRACLFTWEKTAERTADALREQASLPSPSKDPR